MAKRGAKSKWSDSDIITIRVPRKIKDQVVKVAHQIDKNGDDWTVQDSTASSISEMIENFKTVLNDLPVDQFSIEQVKILQAELEEQAASYIAEIDRLQQQIDSLSRQDLVTGSANLVIDHALDEQDFGGNARVCFEVIRAALQGVDRSHVEQAVHYLDRATSDDKTENNKNRRLAYEAVGLEPPKITRTPKY